MQENVSTEKWKKLITPLYPQIESYYWISTKGRIYSCKTNKFIKTRCLDSKTSDSPYYKVNLQILVGRKHYAETFLLHRLMMSVFYPIPNMDKMLVNHIDGNKLNDDITNLEWATPSENIIHALKNGLYKPVCGEDHVCSTLSTEEVKKIIKMLLSRELTHSEIADKMQTSVSIVDSIASKRAWKHLTNDIDFSSLSQRIPKKFTFKQIHGICKFFECNRKPIDMSVRRYCMYALHEINYGEINESILNGVRSIYNKTRYVNISSNYDF